MNLTELSHPDFLISHHGVHGMMGLGNPQASANTSILLPFPAYVTKYRVVQNKSHPWIIFFDNLHRTPILTILSPFDKKFLARKCIIVTTTSP